MIDDAGQTNEDDLLRRFDDIAGRLNKARSALSEVVLGQEEVVDLTLTTLAAGGHGLLVGAPGLAKTLLVTTVAELLGLSEKRVQFTPDLMPGDILGSEVLEESADGKREFRFIPGPVFCQLLMADEINRASPRTTVSAVTGDAGAACYRGWRPSRPAIAVSRARHTKPHRTGRHLSAA